MIEAQKPKIFAILNVTPDSFSDGGLYNNKEQAILHFENICNNANNNKIYAIDVGAVSTRPNSQMVSQEDEFKRLITILPNIVSIRNNKKYNQKISLDSYNYDTIKYFVDCGIDIINDVSGISDERLVEILKSNTHLKIVFMHSLTKHSDLSIMMQSHRYDLLDEIVNFATLKIAKMLDNGIKLNRIIFDPGIGFNKNHSQGLFIMQNYDYLNNQILHSLKLKNTGDLKILIGHSRKSILKHFSNFDLIFNKFLVSQRTSANPHNTNNLDTIQHKNMILDILTDFTTSTLLTNYDFIRTHFIE